jgi:hypothetical protein
VTRPERTRTPAPFDPLPVLRVLQRHGVAFVMIGGFAGRIHGSPTMTNDLDLCYARDHLNLERLAAGLRELRATLRGAPGSLSFRVDARSLKAGSNFTFATDAGSLDALGSPAGVRSFEELDRAAVGVDLDGIRVRVASVDDLIRMKLAAARPKDLIEAEVLGALREEIEAREDAERRGGRGRA